MAPQGQLGVNPWEFHPLTPERWADFEELFGDHGAAGGGWCMWWRLAKREFDAQKGEGNMLLMVDPDGKAFASLRATPALLM